MLHSYRRQNRTTSVLRIALTAFFLCNCGSSKSSVSERLVVRNRTDQLISVQYRTSKPLSLDTKKTKTIEPGVSEEISILFDGPFEKITVTMGESEKTYNISRFDGSIAIKTEDFE